MGLLGQGPVKEWNFDFLYCKDRGGLPQARRVKGQRSQRKKADARKECFEQDSGTELEEGKLLGKVDD